MVPHQSWVGWWCLYELADWYQDITKEIIVDNIRWTFSDTSECWGSDWFYVFRDTLNVKGAHRHKHTHHSFPASFTGNCVAVYHNVSSNISGLQRKYTPTLQAGLFVQPACNLDAGGVWWRWKISWLYIILFMSVKYTKETLSSVESDSPRSAFTPPSLTIIVIQCKLRRCLCVLVSPLCMCVWAVRNHRLSWVISLKDFDILHVNDL